MSKIFTAALRSLRTLWSRAPQRVAYIFFLPIVFAASPLKAQILWVPDNQPTIQAAINAAATDDVIYVRPGTYSENINFFGKSVSVISEQGSAVTIIDGGQHDSVVTYTGGERGTLAGFTIRNGRPGFDTPGFGDGGGIRIVNGARPVILQNVITTNRACTGVGISSRFSSPDIRENLITGNIQSGCSGGVGGGGISVTGDEGQFLFTQIVGNTITDNSLNSASGAGISLFAAAMSRFEEISSRAIRRRDCLHARKVAVFGLSIPPVPRSCRISSLETAPVVVAVFIGQLLSILQDQNCLTIRL